MLISSVTFLAAAVIAAAPLTAREAPQAEDSREQQNRAFITDAFAKWAAGQGDVFSLLADDVTWHITGQDTQVAATHHSRQALLDAAAKPLAARLSQPLKPTVRRIWADGDDVLVHWDGAAPVYDGTQYRNTYMWILTVRDRKIVAVTAFLDNAAFKRVLDKPAP